MRKIFIICSVLFLLGQTPVTAKDITFLSHRCERMDKKPILPDKSKAPVRMPEISMITFYENGNGTGRSATFAEMSINKTYSHIDYLSSYGFDNLTSSFKVIYDNIM